MEARHSRPEGMINSNHYGAVEFVNEEDAFLPSTRVARQQHQSNWKLLAMGAIVIVGLGLCISVQTTLSHQQKMMMTLQKQLDVMHATLLDNQQTVSDSRSHRFTYPHLPHKLAIPHVTPLKTQDNRGTCWDFATVGVLEHSYRQQGINNGWLKENEYVAFSEQAYGAEILRLCQGPPNSLQHIACLLPGNKIWNNSTEGGESAELYYLMNGLTNSIAPHSVCPYYPDAGNDTICEGFTLEKRARNPLKVKIHSLNVLYEEISVKQALVKHQRAMALTTSMPYITHYYPCIGEYSDDPRCNPSSPQCTLCPVELSMSTCCIPLPNHENYNMNGEFLATTRGMTIEGGHVVTLVGYNDLYRTKQGFTGGFIVKNSWFDGIHPPLGPRHARGSHSIAYWLQEVSDWEERTMCPNSYSPYNWYQCGNNGEVIHASGGDAAPAKTGVDSCLSDETNLFAKTNIQPLHLQCTNGAYCNTQEEIIYFVRNATEWGDAMHVMCLFEYNTNLTQAHELCMPPMRMEALAYIFSPVQDEILENDPDVCGFYFYPYEVQRLYTSKFEGFYVNDFHIEWDQQSYVANQELYPDLDYTDVMASTKNQHQYEFNGPIPLAKVVPKQTDL